MSNKLKLIALLIILLYNNLLCQTFRDEDLRKVESLGRELYEYDLACWIASDTLQASKPDQSNLETFLAYRENNLWKVGFGKLNEESGNFLVAYEATFNPQSKECKISTFKDPQKNSGFYFNAARALKKMLSVAPNEYPPYNFAVLPADSDNLLLYFYPAQTTWKNYRLGGDIKYVYNIHKGEITDSLRMHKSILMMPYTRGKDQEIKSSISSAILTSTPVETDILYVLSRKFPAEHYVIAKEWVFILTSEGKIVKFPAEEFMKSKSE